MGQTVIHDESWQTHRNFKTGCRHFDFKLIHVVDKGKDYHTLVAVEAVATKGPVYLEHTI